MLFRSACGRCGHRLGYDPANGTLLALDSDGPGFRAVRGTRRRFFCANASQDACNWLLPEGCGDSFCLACQHNGTVPDLSVQSNLTGWRELEAAKHRLMYSLLRWRLPLRTCTQDPEHGLIFNFLADTPALLVRDGGELEACRLHFCDDSRDYQSALEHHYRLAGTLCFGLSFGASMGGLRRDLGHYVHIVDTLEMAGNFGIQVAPAAGSSADFAAKIDFDPNTVDDFERVVAAWLPFVFAMNSVNRAIGSKDLYPFVLAPAVIEKLKFIHRLVQKSAEPSRE